MTNQLITHRFPVDYSLICHWFVISGTICNCGWSKEPATLISQLSLTFDYCVRGTRTQPLICVGCSVHYWMSCAINKGGFFKIAFAVDTHLPHFEVIAYVLPHANSRGGRCTTQSKSTELCSSSVAVVPQSKSTCTELCSPVAVVPHKVNLLSCVARRPFSVTQIKSTELCSSSAAVVPQSKSTELCRSGGALHHKKTTQMWSSAAPFHHDLWYFGTGQRNILALCYLFGKKIINKPTVAPLKSLKSTHSTKLLKKLLTWAHTFHWRLWWFLWNRWEV